MALLIGNPVLRACSDVAPYQYEQAFAMIKESEKQGLERPISLQVSYKVYSRLMEHLGYEDSEKKWPRCSFDSSISKMTIQWKLSPVHECIPFVFLKEFHKSTADLPNSLQSRITITGAEDTCGFSGRYMGSQKAPDMSIKFRDFDEKRSLKTVFEVGFAENYHDLVQDAKSWLEGKHTVVLVILTNVEEMPPFKSPLQHLSDIELAQLNLPDSLTIEESDFSFQDEYGPVMYQGLCWVGKITSASLEIWRRDSVTGLARIDGDRFDIFGNTNFRLKLSDIVGTTLEHDRTISVSSEELRSRMKEEIAALAQLRYQRAWEKYTEVVDHDYQPATSASP